MARVALRRNVLIYLLAVVTLSCTSPSNPGESPVTVEAPPPLVTPEANLSPPLTPAPAGEPDATPTSAPEVVLNVGDDFQAVVDAHEPGTRYLIAAGLHRLQQVIPQDGDVFVGEAGAVLSGARDISDDIVEWRREGGQWYVEGQTQEGSTGGRIREGGRNRDLRPEDLFADGRRYIHVGGRKALEPGSFFFEYQRDRIWLAEDPADLGLIETSVTSYAFSGEDVSNVTIENLVIERYATPAQQGAVGGERVHDWTLRRLIVRENHGLAIRVGPGFTVEDSSVVDNGQMGIGGAGVDEETGYTAPLVIRRNEIARNGLLDYDLQWEGGGTKFVLTYAGIVVEDNWVHDNFGHGLWFDIDVYSALVRRNLVEANQWRGVFYEISRGSHPELGGRETRIVENEVRGNGHGAVDLRRGAAIGVSNSQGIEVANNLLYDNYGGIVVAQVPGRQANTARVVVRGNDLSYRTGCTGFLVEGGYSDREAEGYVTEAEVVFTDNVYRDIPDDGFCWIKAGVGREAWAQLAEERVDGRPQVQPAISPPPPVSADQLSNQVYGPA